MTIPKWYVRFKFCQASCVNNGQWYVATTTKRPFLLFSSLDLSDSRHTTCEHSNVKESLQPGLNISVSRQHLLCWRHGHPSLTFQERTQPQGHGLYLVMSLQPASICSFCVFDVSFVYSLAISYVCALSILVTLNSHLSSPRHTHPLSSCPSLSQLLLTHWVSSVRPPGTLTNQFCWLDILWVATVDKCSCHVQRTASSSPPPHPLTPAFSPKMPCEPWGSWHRRPFRPEHSTVTDSQPLTPHCWPDAPLANVKSSTSLYVEA